MRIFRKNSVTSIIHHTASIGENTKIWENSHIREYVVVGDNTILGEGVYLDVGVKVGMNCKIQNLCQVFGPTVIGDGSFLGPGVIITNDRLPRATDIHLNSKSRGQWKVVGSTIGKGASLGAGVICISPVEIGEWSMIGAGSVVTKNTPNYSLMVGSPAKLVGWVGKSGEKLIRISENLFQDPKTNEQYQLKSQTQLELQ